MKLGHLIRSHQLSFLNLRFVCLLAASAALLAPQTVKAQCAVKDSDFKLVSLQRSLAEPMVIDIDAHDRVFIAERRTGNLKIYNPKTEKTVIAATIQDLYRVNKRQSAGFLGLALHPNFEVNKHLFILYTPASPIDSGLIRLSRVTVQGDAVNMATEKVVAEFPMSFECCHQAGDIKFGQNNQLFIGTGNNRTGVDFKGSADISPNPMSYAGKILRIKIEDNGTYSIPAGNLYSDPKDGLPEIYVSGTRNPYRLGVDKKTNWLYWGEVGPDGPRREEMNQARAAGFFGYPYFFGQNEPTVADFSGQKANAPTYKGKALPPAQPALIAYALQQGSLLLNKAGDTKKLEIQGSCAYSGPIYHFDPSSPSKTRVPEVWDKRWFTLDMKAKWFSTVSFTEDGYVKNFEHILSNLGTDILPRDNLMYLGISPRGDMYILEYGATWRTNNGNSGLFKVEYTGNCNPVGNEAEWLAKQTVSIHRERLASQGLVPHAIPVDARRVLLPAGATSVELYDLQGKLVWSRNNIAVPASGWVEIPSNLNRTGLLFARFPDMKSKL